MCIRFTIGHFLFAFFKQIFCKCRLATIHTYRQTDDRRTQHCSKSATVINDCILTKSCVSVRQIAAELSLIIDSVYSIVVVGVVVVRDLYPAPKSRKSLGVAA